MPLHLAAIFVVNLAVGLALLLAWRYDRSQPFTRWIGLSFLVNALTAPATVLYFYTPGWMLAGAALWAAQQAVSLLLLLHGVSQFSGTGYPGRQLVAWGSVMFLVLAVSAFLGPVSAATVSATFFSILVVVVSRRLFLGGDAEKVAAVLLAGNAFAWWITPVFGLEHYPTQAYLVATIRLLLGLALLMACLHHSAIHGRQLGEQFMRLIEGSHQGVAVVQREMVVYTNPALQQLVHLVPGAQVPVNWGGWGLEPSSLQMPDGRRTILRDGDRGEVSWTHRWRRADGAELYLRFSAWRIEWQGSAAEQVVVSDETEAHASAQRLIYEATHDRLTGLLNRQGMEELVRERKDAPFVLILLDLDRFSLVNDGFGHQLGDELLQMVAARIDGSLSDGDVLARVAGDEFVVLHSISGDAGGEEGAAALAEKVLGVLRQPLQISSLNLNLSASAGTASFPADGENFSTLLGHANLAAKSAKAAGRNTVHAFKRAMSVNVLDDLQLVNDLHDALRSRQFELHFQPVLAINTGSLLGTEALIRWTHPQHGAVSPARFIPLAERTGLIIDIGAWVIHEACSTLAAWQDSPTLAGLTVAINVSATQFGRGDLDQVLADALEQHKAPRHLLELEVTESALINEPEQFVEMLGRLRALGVRLAIDDFGTGYSNLAYLQRFKVDKLKIDQSFVRNLGGGDQDRAIVQAVIQMARSLGLKTTAEGIESPEVLQMLATLGCDQAQGYHFSPPLRRDRFEHWCSKLGDRHWKSETFAPA